MTRTQITAEEIRKAFRLPPGTPLMLRLEWPASHCLPVAAISIGDPVRCSTPIESDPTYIPG